MCFQCVRTCCPKKPSLIFLLQSEANASISARFYTSLNNQVATSFVATVHNVTNYSGVNGRYRPGRCDDVGPVVHVPDMCGFGNTGR